MDLERGTPDLDDDGRPRRTGTFWTATAHVITGVIGSGVLSLAWSMAQLGWICGPIMLVLCAWLTYYTAAMLADCYRYPNPQTGTRSRTYSDVVATRLNWWQHKWCLVSQYSNLAATSVGYSVTGGLSMANIAKTNCLHKSNSSCGIAVNKYVMIFGAIQLVVSQIPNFHQLWWLSYVATTMSFTYSFIALGLGIWKISTQGWNLHGSRTGTPGAPAQKTWAVFQSLGNITFAYSFAMILIEIQDTLKSNKDKSSTTENKTMKRATGCGLMVTTAFYMVIGCVNYAAFGDSAPGNLLQGYKNPVGLIDFTNACIAIHIVGAWQVYSQPIFEAFEGWVSERWPENVLVSAASKEHNVKLPFFSYSWRFTLLRLVGRTLFVAAVTVIAMAMPFFNDIVGLIGALGFWPLTVYFPVEMRIKERNIKKWSFEWFKIQGLSMFCLLLTLAATIGCVEGIVQNLNTYRVFHATI